MKLNIKPTLMLPASGILKLLIDRSEGNPDAPDELFPLIEQGLHRMTHIQMQKPCPGNSLQTTPLINATYIRLVDQNSFQWRNRTHFFAIAARVLRWVLLNYFRTPKVIKLGGRAVQVSLVERLLITQMKSDKIPALEEALYRLSEIDKCKAKVVDLRYYGRLSIEKTAEILKLSPITVTGDWNLRRGLAGTQTKQ